MARRRLTDKLGYSSIGLRFLPMEFTRADAQAPYEALLGQALDRGNFAKQLGRYEEIIETGQKRRDGAHRPAMVFRLRDRQQLTN